MWAKGYGYADSKINPQPKPSRLTVWPRQPPMTAVAVLQLVEKGKIDLDAEVQTYVPYFPKKQWPVTVRQVLGHLGGHQPLQKSGKRITHQRTSLDS